MTRRLMLDTNIVSHLVRRHPAVTARAQAATMNTLCVSAITEAELAYGLSKRKLSNWTLHAIEEFLRRAEVLPWDSRAARRYGTLRADLERQGRSLVALDTQIAAHALALDFILVTNDAAFAQIPDLMIEDWTQPVQ